MALSARGVPSTIVERCEIAAAASGKSGGFLAGGWGDGGVTQALHRESFALHERLAADLELKARSVISHWSPYDRVGAVNAVS
jgi:glycine/D-amino acid oxidase-like deaminating enzyme